jgi:hypothetical protein
MVRNSFSGVVMERILATPLVGSTIEKKVVCEEDKNVVIPRNPFIS